MKNNMLGRNMLCLMAFAILGSSQVQAQWLSGYCYRKPLTIDATKVDDTDAADLTNFPVLISLTDNDLRTMTNDGNVEHASGWDISVTSTDGTTELELQIESYVANTGEYIAWVKVPTLDYNDATVLYLYYGNSAISTDPSAESVWDSNFAAIWHLNEATGSQVLDATSNNMDEAVNAGAPYTYTYTKNTNTSSIDGVVSDARSFNNAGNLASDDNYIEIPHVASNALDITGTQLTIEVWARMYYPAPQDAPFVVKGIGTTNLERYMFGTQNGSNGINRRITSSTADTANEGYNYFSNCTTDGHYRYDDTYGSADADWHYYVMAYDGVGTGTLASNLKTFIDGSLQTFTEAGCGNPYPYGNIYTATGDLFIGRRDGNNRFFKGAMDEIRISNSARSDGWIITSYNTINDPASFYALGNQEYPLDGGVATASNSQLDTGESTTITLTDYNVSAALQWQSSIDNSSFTDVASANEATLNTGAITQTTYFRLKSTLSGCNAYSTTVSVSVRAAFVPNYAYRSIISVDHTQVECSSSLTDYPLLINISGSISLQQASGKVEDANGYDIIFADESGAQLSHDLERYEGTNGDLVAWVKIPSLLCDANTIIYMYYGDCGYAGGDQSATSTWVSYNGVYHMNDDPNGTSQDDRSVNNNNGTNNNFASDTRLSGQIGQAIDFDGADDYIGFGTGPQISGTGDRTYEAWVYTQTFDANEGVFQAGSPAGNDFSLYELNNSSENFVSDTDNSTDDFTLVSTSSSWHHLAMVYDNSDTEVEVFYDGVLHSVFAGAVNTTVFALELGRWNGSVFDGYMDEFKISSIARSSDWLKTQFNNQNSPGTFYTIDSEVSEFVWTGGTGTDWTDPNNWSTCTVPAGTDDAIIPTGLANYPVLVASQSANYININSGASLDLNGQQLSVTGDIKNDGTFTHSNGSVILNGTGEQNIKGSSAISFYNLQVNKASGTVIMNRDITVDNILTLTAGNIQLNDIALTIGSGGAISGGTATSFVETTGSSCLAQQNIGAGGRTGSITFPVGAMGSTYTPLTVDNTTGTADDFCVYVCLNVYEGGGCTGTQITSKVVNKTWDVTPNTGTGLDVTVSLQWNGVDETGDFVSTDAYMSHYKGGNWNGYTGSDVSGQGDPYTLSQSGISTFSPFGVGSSNSTLPVELVFFKGYRNKEAIHLEWQTSSEIENDIFEIERSKDGVTFYKVAEINGNGTTNLTIDYAYKDYSAVLGMNYYRLKQIDFSNVFEYSNIISVNNSPSLLEQTIIVYPNPSNGWIKIDNIAVLSGPVTLRLTDISGRTVWEKTFLDVSNATIIDINPLQTGHYILMISSNGFLSTQKVVKQ